MKFPSRSLLSAAVLECGELSLVGGIRHCIRTCDGVHSKKLKASISESSHDVIGVQHSSIPLLYLHQSLGTQFPYPEKENDEDVHVSSLRMRMTFYPYRTASIMKLTIITSASSWLNRPSSSPTINIFGPSVHVQRRRDRSILCTLLFIVTSLLGRVEVRVIV